MVHVDACSIAPCDRITLNDRVLDGGIAEVDPEAYRIIHRMAGGHTFQRTDQVLHDVVPHDHTIAMIEGDTGPIVQDGCGVAHDVLLAQHIVLDADADVTDVGEPVAAHDRSRAGRIYPHMAPKVLSHPGMHGDIAQYVVLDQRIAVKDVQTGGVGILDRKVLVHVVAAGTEDPIVAMAQHTILHRHIVGAFSADRCGSVPLNGEVLDLDVRTLPVCDHPFRIDRCMYGERVGVRVVGCPQVQLAGGRIVVPFTRHVQLAQFVRQEETPVVVADVGIHRIEIERTVAG